MNSNVYPLRPRRPVPQDGGAPMTARRGAFDQLTDRLVMAQASAGTLNPAIVAALLAAVRQPSQGSGR